MPFLSTPKALGVSGVYAILNTNTGKSYIGSSVDLRKRLLKHFDFLEKGGHHSLKLQNSWNKHGANAFDCKILELVGKEDLLTREQFFLDFFKSSEEGGYNISRIAGSPMSGKKHSADTKQKMSERGKLRRHTEEEKKKIGEANSKRVWKKESIEKMSNSLKELAKTRIDSDTLRLAKSEGSKQGWAAIKSDPEKYAKRLEQLKVSFRHIWTEEERAEMSRKRKGVALSEEHRKKISEGSKGKPKSEEHRKKISEAHKLRCAKIKKAAE